MWWMSSHESTENLVWRFECQICEALDNGPKLCCQYMSCSNVLSFWVSRPVAMRRSSVQNLIKNSQIYTPKQLLTNSKHQICNIKIFVRKTSHLQHQIYVMWEKNNMEIYVRKKRQICNLKIYVRKKRQICKLKTKPKFTTSLTTSKTTLDVCQNTDIGKILNQIIHDCCIPKMSLK